MDLRVWRTDIGKVELFNLMKEAIQQLQPFSSLETEIDKSSKNKDS
jgi:hypothetical protein